MRHCVKLLLGTGNGLGMALMRVVLKEKAARAVVRLQGDISRWFGGV